MSQTADYHATRVQVTPETRDRLLSDAREWAEELGALRGSIEDGDGNVAGRYAELVFTEAFGGTIADHYEYDVSYNGLALDIKTKRRTVAAKPHYEASIADWNTEQDCDLYFFASVLCGDDVTAPFHHVDLLGYIAPAEYYRRAEFHAEGDRDPDNGFTFTTDCYNLEYRALQRQPDAPRGVTL